MDAFVKYEFPSCFRRSGCRNSNFFAGHNGESEKTDFDMPLIQARWTGWVKYNLLNRRNRF